MSLRMPHMKCALSVELSAFRDTNVRTLDDIRETVTTLAEIEPIARRVFGGAHPLTEQMERELRHAREMYALREEIETNQALIARNARAALRARKTQCALACALVMLLVALVAAIVFKR